MPREGTFHVYQGIYMYIKKSRYQGLQIVQLDAPGSIVAPHHRKRKSFTPPTFERPLVVSCPQSTNMASDKKLVRSKSGLRMVAVNDALTSPLMLCEPPWVPDNAVRGLLQSGVFSINVLNCLLAALFSKVPAQHLHSIRTYTLI